MVVNTAPCPRTARLRAALCAELARRALLLDADPGLRRIELVVTFTADGWPHRVAVRTESVGTAAAGELRGA